MSTEEKGKRPGRKTLHGIVLASTAEANQATKKGLEAVREIKPEDHDEVAAANQAGKSAFAHVREILARQKAKR